MNFIERDLLREVYHTKIMISSALASGLVAKNSKAAELPRKAMDTYFELTLPYQARKDKIKNKTIGNKDFKSVRALLDAKNKLAKNARR